MLIGEYTHTIDEKSRVSLPSKFRKELGKNVVVTRGLDNCLFLYSPKAWAVISKKLGQLPFGQSDSRGFNRFMFAGAVEVDVDQLGRILIPDFLKSFAGLSEKVIFAGLYDRVEIWNEKHWGEYKKKIEDQGDQLAEKLGEIGAV
ncbi:MAG: division/cell wall cluster transcriptional repressor MraZ [bacterium]|nr:division/cell wall cluster transcriptional repressor MraZ [bacterium]